jgi:hypothetical protein
MRTPITAIALALALCLTAATGAQAYNTTFFGEDLGLGEGTALGSYPNASAAESTFLSHLTGVGTEDFESFADDTPAPLGITFPGAGSATLLGSGNIEEVLSGTNGVGRYPISGDNYWESSAQFSIDFENPVAAFGFYGIDIGDYSGQLTVIASNGLGSTSYTVDNTINGSGGSVLYWGVIDTDNPFTSIEFGNTASGSDYFGFDDMTIGSLEQVNPNPVPEPSTLALLGLGVIPMGFRRIRRRFFG